MIAGEGCVESDAKCKKFRVHISAAKSEEKEIYTGLLKKLNIVAYNYPGDKIVISKRENLIQLLKQRLMTLHPKKYNKFLHMMQKYPHISEETKYFTGEKKIWNKITEEKTNKILELYQSGITKTSEIAENLGINQIKVQRLLKENNLGYRRTKFLESKRKEIANFAKDNPKLNMEKISKIFGVSKSVVSRAYIKYYGKRGMKAKCRIPKEIENEIIEMYKEDPEIKFSEIMEELNVSDSVIMRVRKENNLNHLGFKHLVGNNNKKIAI